MAGSGAAAEVVVAEVVVAVVTYRRPTELSALLPVLVAQAAAVPGGGVLVVDNDPAESARDVVTAVADLRVRYVAEPRPGIAAARNRALDESVGSRLLVFIDDDEEPVRGWLSHLVETWAVSRPAAVVGPVRSTFAGELSPFVAAGRFFDRRQLPTGSTVQVAATNNLLLDLAQVSARNLRFDEDFGLSGGSDTLFTRQLVASGGRMVWCAEALVVDRVPAPRTTARWVLMRALRSGNSWSRTSLHLSEGALDRLRLRARLSTAGLTRAAGGAARALLGVLPGQRAHRAKGLRTAMRGVGMLLGAFGYVYAEYRRPRAV